MADLPKFASVGDSIQCDLHFPYPHTRTMKLETRESAAYANELLTDPKSGWRLVRTDGVNPSRQEQGENRG